MPQDKVFGFGLPGYGSRLPGCAMPGLEGSLGQIFAEGGFVI